MAQTTIQEALAEGELLINQLEIEIEILKLYKSNSLGVSLMKREIMRIKSNMNYTRKSLASEKSIPREKR